MKVIKDDLGPFFVNYLVRDFPLSRLLGSLLAACVDFDQICLC